MGGTNAAVGARLRAAAALAVALLFVAPLVFMITGSLRSVGTPPRTPQLWPSPVRVESYDKVFGLTDLGRQLVNSTIVVGLTVPITLIVASSAGFAAAMLGRRIAATVVLMSLIALMIPATSLMVGRLVVFRRLGLTDTLLSLVAPALIGTSPLYALLFYWAFRRLPRELLEAAVLEGMRPVAIWWRVALPLVRPVVVAVAVLTAVTSWSNVLDPLIYLSDPRLFTVPLGLRNLAQLDRGQHPILLAGAVISTLPVVLACLVAQRSMRGTRWVGT